MNKPPFKNPRRGPAKGSAKQRILAEWRGVDLAPLEVAKTDRAQLAGNFLKQIMGDIRLDRRRDEAEIVKVWNHLMDPNIAAHAQPTGINKGTLFVTVDSSVWLDEIVRYRRKEILDRLHHTFGKEAILKISFRVG